MIMAYLISNPQFTIWNITYITSHHDYSYLLDLRPINSIQLDDKLCLCSFQRSKRKKVSLKDRAYYCWCTNYVLCISRDTRHSYGWHYKCKDSFGGLKLCGVLLVSKRSIWVTMHFSEIIKLQFGKEHHTFLCNLKLFLQILLINYLWKMLGYPQCYFWISITTVTICFPAYS